ncbi:hypothetical protein ABZW18_25855 [Streptomyces sp. NPDC004647]|uniref:hypothetical protein n=1 Tax=Streptomyces sp. NPDC004647 TaxID=3154671 RepID=UPI0033BB4E71
MDPRQLWNRNTALAEAFCLSDEHVRSAQSALDETQAHRSRLLAAFAVTVGSDSAVADLLGLSEREVRIARRTVGKDDARRMADDVLARAAAGEPEDESVPEPAPTPQHAAPHPSQASAHQPQPQPQPQSQPQPQQYVSHAAPQQYEVPMTVPEPAPATNDIPGVRETAWTSAMDLVLIDSWQSGIDLRVLADEFGLDLARLVARVQQLSAEGRLMPQQAAPAEDRSGRHRRDMHGTSGYDPYGTSVGTSSWEAPSTIPDEMLASYLPPQHTWPQYMSGSGVR